MKTIFEYLANRPALVLFLGAVIYLSLGFGQDGINLDSTTYSVIARSMVEEGRWFNPTYTDFYLTEFTVHPPLVMWGEAIVFSMFGADDSTARIFGALCTIGAIMAAFLLGREIKGPAFGFLSGLVLLLTYNFIQNGNTALFDVPVSFFMLMALYGLAAMQNDNWKIKPHIITGVALGCAFLSKGVVSAPAWIAVAVTVLFLRRDWFKSGKFWCVPAFALGIVVTHVVLDQVFAGGVFTDNYFARQIWSHWSGHQTAGGTPWWFFTYRFVVLYLPFTVLLPIGLYFLVRRKLSLLYPTAIALVTFILFSSKAFVLYYHYYCPAYALAAPLAALPLFIWLRESHVRKLAVGFIIAWALLGIGISISGMKVHHVRAPELYELRDTMQTVLADHPTRHGLYVREGIPRWDYVAKTSWYWRSDMKQVGDIAEAIRLFKSDNRFAYIFTDADKRLSDEDAAAYGLVVFAENGGIVVYGPEAESN